MGDGGEQSTLIAEDWGYLNSPLGKNIAVASMQWFFIFPDFTISKYCFCFSLNVPLGFPIPFFSKISPTFFFSASLSSASLHSVSSFNLAKIALWLSLIFVYLFPYLEPTKNWRSPTQDRFSFCCALGIWTMGREEGTEHCGNEPLFLKEIGGKTSHI